MFAAKASKNTSAVALRDVAGAIVTESVHLNREVMFFEEDVTVDPLARMSDRISTRLIGGHLQSQGFYGFRLKPNSKGYTTIFIHAGHMEIV